MADFCLCNSESGSCLFVELGIWQVFARGIGNLTNFACGIRKLADFYSWNSKSGSLFFACEICHLQIFGFEIRNPANDWSPQSKFH